MLFGLIVLRRFVANNNYTIQVLPIFVQTSSPRLVMVIQSYIIIVSGGIVAATRSAHMHASDPQVQAQFVARPVKQK